MITFEQKKLGNGLTVVLHADPSTTLAAVNVLYKVGSGDEHPDHTGFSHLFEHLMFGGTEAVPNFDEVIQQAGGENNAFTNNDITNFYNIGPAENLSVLLWLEADRMRKSQFKQKALDTQKSVVIEEFKETCLNEPYGDMWHHLGPLVYGEHQYAWPTIGKEFSHIEQATLEEVNSFYQNYYRPNNAILSITGNIDIEKTYELIDTYFGDIPAADIRRPAKEHINPFEKRKVIKALVPLPSITIAFKMGKRLDDQYYIADLVSDILGNGRSSRLYSKFVNELELCVSIDCFITGATDEGLLIIEARIKTGVDIYEVERLIWEEITSLKKTPITARELQKIKNKAESNLIFSETGTLNKAISLAYYAYIERLDLINSEDACYQKVTVEDITHFVEAYMSEEQASTLIYEPLPDPNQFITPSVKP